MISKISRSRRLSCLKGSGLRFLAILKVKKSAFTLGLSMVQFYLQRASTVPIRPDGHRVQTVFWAFFRIDPEHPAGWI